MFPLFLQQNGSVKYDDIKLNLFLKIFQSVSDMFTACALVQRLFNTAPCYNDRAMHDDQAVATTISTVRRFLIWTCRSNGRQRILNTKHYFQRFVVVNFSIIILDTFSRVAKWFYSLVSVVERMWF